jgi:hypothetical protein
MNQALYAHMNNKRKMEKKEDGDFHAVQGTPSSFLHSWAATEGSLQQSLSLTDCSNGELKGFPLL